MRTGLAEITSGKPEAVESGFDKLERASWIANRKYEHKFAIELATGVIPCSKACVARFRALTGCHPVAYGFTGSDAPAIDPVLPHSDADRWCDVLLNF